MSNTSLGRRCRGRSYETGRYSPSGPGKRDNVILRSMADYYQISEGEVLDIALQLMEKIAYADQTVCYFQGGKGGTKKVRLSILTSRQREKMNNVSD